jgi:hypothetical protein
MGVFFWAAPLLKHQGFKEENEARIVAIPGTQYDWTVFVPNTVIYLSLRLRPFLQEMAAVEHASMWRSLRASIQSFRSIG